MTGIRMLGSDVIHALFNHAAMDGKTRCGMSFAWSNAPFTWRQLLQGAERTVESVNCMTCIANGP